MKKKSIIISGAVVVALTAVVIVMMNTAKATPDGVSQGVQLAPDGASSPAQAATSKVLTTPTSNVHMSGGKQIVEITVASEGGYFPKVSQATANVPTVIKLVTNHTFGCASTVVIPSLNFQETLAQTGTKEVSLPTQAAGATLQGVCGMGMYNFEVNFN